MEDETVMLPKTTEGTVMPTPGRISSVSTHVEEVIKGTIAGSENRLPGCTEHFPESMTAACRRRGTAGAGVPTDRAALGWCLPETSAVTLEKLWDEQTGSEEKVATWPGAYWPAPHPPERTDKAQGSQPSPPVTWGDSQCDHIQAARLGFRDIWLQRQDAFNEGNVSNVGKFKKIKLKKALTVAQLVRASSR